MARVLYPDLEKANLVYPTLLFDLLPVGLLGLVIAGLIAAMMSSTDSALNSASTLVTMDFYKKWRPSTSPEALMWTGRAVTFLFMIAAAAWAPQIDNFPTLWEYLQSALSYICPPIVSVFVLGMFWKRGNGNGAFAAVIIGTGLAVYLLFQPNIDIHYLYIALILFIVCSLTLIVTSLITPAVPEKKIIMVSWSSRFYRAESDQLRRYPFYKNYRYQAVVLILVIIIILAFYW
jgi:SSS family solute:Na+ symporter